MNFFERAGKMALGSRVRLLADKFTAEASSVYKAYGTELQPKWFPVFYVLSQSGPCAASAVAEEIGHSHASVSKILSEMGKAGLIQLKTDPEDRRRTLLRLSRKGESIASKIEHQYTDVRAAVESLSKEATTDLWAALEEWEYLLGKKSFAARVRDEKKARESANVVVEPYRPKHQAVFRDLNEDWIRTYFKMEKPDFDALENPKRYILDRGGHILVASREGKALGVCALVPKEKGVYELAKMAVSREARGQHLGWILGQAAIKKARSLGAKKLYLESNTILKPAIGLYEKLGFRKVVGRPTPYERCNIQMELELPA